MVNLFRLKSMRAHGVNLISPYHQELPLPFNSHYFLLEFNSKVMFLRTL